MQNHARKLAVLAGAILFAAGAARAAPPTQDEIAKMWSGGTWVPDRFKMGSWMSGFKTVEEYTNPDFVPPNPVPLKPGPMKVYKNIRSEMGKGHQIFGPYAQCHPAGLPYRFSIGYFTVVSNPVEIDFLYADLNYRRIYMDGRPAPDPATTAPSYYGHSLGHWEGGSLVIETTNIRGSNTQTEPHIPKAEGSRIVERYTPEGPDVMAVTFTMTNPDFTKPWTVDFKILRDPKRVLVEDICSDGNRYTLEQGGELTMHAADGKPLERAED